MKYLVGMLCGGLMECPEFSFSFPYVIVKNAPSLKDALEFYNRKYHCEYFFAGCIASIKDNSLYKISDYISKNEAKTIFKKASEIEYYNIVRNNRYYFSGTRISRYGVDIAFWDSLSDLKEVLHEKNDLYIEGTNDEGLSCVWSKNICIGYTNLK